MIKDSVSKKSLDEPGGSDFVEFVVNALFLLFVVDELPPLLLNLDCRGGS
jgi:hypothetical protein